MASGCVPGSGGRRAGSLLPIVTVPVVQSFYGKKGVYLKQIATKGIFTGF